VIAAASNGGGYANEFQRLESESGNSGILPAVLGELWDFDTRISSDSQGNPTPQDYLQKIVGSPVVRGYNQFNDHMPNADFAVWLGKPSWSTYNGAAEIPPLPPGPYNDTGSADDQNQAPQPINYLHHLIRDFTFLDAAKNNSVTSLFPEPPWLTTNDYQVVRLPSLGIDPQGPEAYVLNYTEETGHHQGQYYLLEDTDEPVDNAPLTFTDQMIGFTALLYELRDSSGNAAQVAPNWFGVAVPDGITDFRNVIIYFHPNPGQAGYSPGNYLGKSWPAGDQHGGVTGTEGKVTDWKELFAYAGRLGKQLAGAALQAGGSSTGVQNQIVIIPFMRSYRDVGVLPAYWSFIVKSILDDLYQQYLDGNLPALSSGSPMRGRRRRRS
jgi:hypothetical protein